MNKYISSLYSYNFAKISLARASGSRRRERQGIFQRKMNMVFEASPPRSAPDAGKESPHDPSPLTKKYAAASVSAVQAVEPR